MMEDRAVVVEVGASCWIDEPTPRAIPGDHVLVAKFAGYIAETLNPEDVDEQGHRVLYRLINERDIFCKLEAAYANR